MTESSLEVPAGREPVRDAVGGLFAVLLGIVAFFAFAGWQILLPTNIGWLNFADRAMHTMGWFFYRDAPWGTPPGASPNLGIELSNSIALVDGLPLFALPFKLISQWLPRPFQYWGYWWLISYILQSVFAYRLARELDARRLIALLAAAFCLITPAFILRMPMHMALGGHWVVIASLYLNVKRKPPRFYEWPLLIALTSAIHAYLLAMVLGLWIASLIQRLISGRAPAGRVLLEIPVSVVLIGVIYWATGFFYTGSLGTYGFGFYRLNLMGPFIDYEHRWSQLVPPLPHGEYDYEGTSFLGIGIFGVLILSIFSGAIVRLRDLFTTRWLTLWIVILLMIVFAWSNNLGFLNHETGPIPIPSQLEELGRMFRSSGRFVWPALYLVTIGAVVLLSRRFSPGWALVTITALFAAQVVDSAPGLTRFHNTLPAPSNTWQTPLVSPFWSRVPEAGYTRVRAIPVITKSPDWQALEYYAYTHHMQTDAVYLGRVDDKAKQALTDANNRAIETGTLEPQTLYVIDVRTALALARTLQPTDLLAVIDGRIVYARNGAKLVEGLGIDAHSAVDGNNWVPPIVRGAHLWKPR